VPSPRKCHCGVFSGLSNFLVVDMSIPSCLVAKP
jgi:hypothetical protein